MTQERTHTDVPRLVLRESARVGLSTADLAAVLGVAPRTVANLLTSGYQGHSIRTLTTLAETCGCRLEVRFVKDESIGREAR